MDVFVARQPIFDEQQDVYGYELLYRASFENKYSAVDGDKATLDVIRNMVICFGTERISAGRRVFVNFTRDLLLDEMALLLPKEITVIEILEDVKIDGVLIQACQKLQESGYLLGSLHG